MNSIFLLVILIQTALCLPIISDRCQEEMNIFHYLYAPSYTESPWGQQDIYLTPNRSAESRMFRTLWDSSGKLLFQPGDFGDYDNCRATKNLTYCYYYLLPKSGQPSPPFGLGLCLPSACGADYVLGVYENVAANLGLRGHAVCGDDVGYYPFNGSAVISLTVAILLVLGVAIATVGDILRQRDDRQPNVYYRLRANLTSPIRNTNETWWLSFCASFSLVRSYQRLVNANVKSSRGSPFGADIPETAPLHGLRCLTLMWIIFGHTYLFAELVAANRSKVIWPTGFHAQPLYIIFRLGYHFAFDCFLFVNGFLVARTYALRSYSSIPRKVGYTFLTRLLRQVPVYFIILLLYAFFVPPLSSGPMWMINDLFWGNCSTYWWRNLLFIHNLFPKSDMCMDWTWFISLDMQFFLTTIFIIVVYSWRKVVGIVLTGACLLACTLSRCLLVIDYNLPALPELDTSSQYYDILYGRPWTRAQGFLLGLAFYFIFEKRVDSESMSPLRTHSIRLISLGFLLLVLCLPIKYLANTSGAAYTGWNGPSWNPEVWTDFDKVFYAGIIPLFWGFGLIGLMWTIFWGSSAGVIGTILNFPFWTKLNRLVFSTYIWHLAIISIVLTSNSAPFYISHPYVIVLFIGLTVVSFFAGFLTYLFIEGPLYGLTYRLGQVEVILPYTHLQYSS